MVLATRNVGAYEYSHLGPRGTVDTELQAHQLVLVFLLVASAKVGFVLKNQHPSVMVFPREGGPQRAVAMPLIVALIGMVMGPVLGLLWDCEKTEKLCLVF
jgi:hypothetical protein